jgi:DNA-binding NarL/FixJ family response regulator
MNTEEKLMKVLVVDDPIASQILKDYLSELSNVIYGQSIHESLTENAPLVSDSRSLSLNEDRSVNEYAAAITAMTPLPDLVAINAHCTLNTGQTRSSCDGLRLAELLRMEKDFNVPIHIYSWRSLQELREDFRYSTRRWKTLVDSLTGLAGATRTPATDLHTSFSRLPFTASDFLSLVLQTTSRFSNSSRPERLSLARCLLEDEMERVCKDIRHKHQNILSSLRLLLGAFAAGDISEAILQNAMSQLGIGDWEGVHDLNQLQLKWFEIEQEISVARISEYESAHSVGNLCAEGTVLIIDDHLYREKVTGVSKVKAVGDWGWLPVYTALLSDSRRFKFNIKGASTYDEGYQRCCDGTLKECSFVILDVDLGEPAKSGLQLLQEIRARDPFLPVIVMTSFDDAEVCQLALELQADAFFAKQLNDRTHRSSLNYYLKFIETLQLVSNSSKQDRVLYYDFADKRPLMVSEDEKAKRRGFCTRLEDGVVGEMTKFFMLLRSINRHYLVEHLLSGSPLKNRTQSLDELMITLLDAIVAWLNWRRPEKSDKVEKLGVWLGERITKCEFWLNKEGDILKREWNKSASNYFGYEVDEIKGQPFAMLFQQYGDCPSLIDLNAGWQKEAYLRKKNLVDSFVNIVSSKRIIGRREVFRVAVQKARQDWTDDEEFIEEARTWVSLRHGAIRSVTLSDVRQLATDFLQMVGTSTQPKIGPKKQENVLTNAVVNNNAIAELILRARRREQFSFSEHSIKSRMGAEAALVGSYLQSMRTDSGAGKQILNAYVGFGPTEDAGEVINVLERECEKSRLHITIKNRKPSSPLSFALIDDHGRENGWAYLCQLIHNDSIVSSIEFLGAESSGESLDNYVASLLRNGLSGLDFLIVDLRMPKTRWGEPEIDTGLCVAKIVKSWDPLIPILLLSARSESITMRNAVIIGATDFFPKEIPGSASKEDVVGYASRFSDLPSRLGLGSEEWLLMYRVCRAVSRELNSLINKITSSAQPNLPLFITRILDDRALGTQLPDWLCLQTGATLEDMRRQVVGHITYLFRRTLFFLFMQQERYLYRWLYYFTSTNSGLRPQLLGYDQVWLNCAMISEFILNVTSLAKCSAQEVVTPGMRNSEEIERIKKYLGNDQYKMCLSIWETRNARRYDDQRNPTLEEPKARMVVNECIKLLKSVGLVELNPPLPATPESEKLAKLRDNLKLSIRRPEVEADLNKTSKSISDLERSFTSDQTHAALLMERVNELKNKRDDLQKELLAISVDEVINHRHVLLEELLLHTD